MDRAVLRRIANESKDEAERLLPVVRTVRATRERGVHESGQAVEQKTLLVRVPGPHKDAELVNVNEVKQQAREQLEPVRSYTELEAVTCRSLHK